MEKNKRIRVAIICHFSNNHIHERLPLRVSLAQKMWGIVTGHKQTTDVADFAQWNTNAFNEMEKYTDKIELHVVSSYPKLAYRKYTYSENGINYHFYKNQDHIQQILHKRWPNLFKLQFRNTRKIIQSILQEIKPDIVHYVGAENPQYSLSALDIPKSIPLLLQLQTLMSDPDFEKNYPISHDDYLFRSEIERSVICHSKYIGGAKLYLDYIRTNISPSGIFVNLKLALAESPNPSKEVCTHDFVYFARDISKSADWAIEAFYIAFQAHPEIRMKVVGSYSLEYMAKLRNRISELGILDSIDFTGELQTHEDVLREIGFARFALLPIKVDLLPGTIREAMSRGLPVVTTVTPATLQLNEKRISLLLSEPGDFQAMANNMIRLVEEQDFATELSQNVVITLSEKYNNVSAVKTNIDIYGAIYNNFYKGIPMPEALLVK